MARARKPKKGDLLPEVKDVLKSLHRKRDYVTKLINDLEQIQTELEAERSAKA